MYCSQYHLSFLFHLVGGFGTLGALATFYSFMDSISYHSLQPLNAAIAFAACFNTFLGRFSWQWITEKPCAPFSKSLLILHLMSVTQVNWSTSLGEISKQTMLSLAGSLEKLSTHPIASCILAEAINLGADINLGTSHFTAVAGMTCPMTDHSWAIPLSCSSEQAERTQITMAWYEGHCVPSVKKFTQ